MTRAVQIAELGDQNVFTVDGDNTRVGIGSTQPTVKLDVTGDGNVSGTLTATSFSGDGSSLTGVASTDNIITGTAATFTNVVKVGTAITLDATSGIITAVNGFVGPLTGNVTGTASLASNLTGTPNITVGNITASSGDLIVRNVTGVAATFTGVLTYEDVTNVDSIGILTARSGIRVGAGQSIGSDGAAVVYYGDGSNLDGVVSGVELKQAGSSVGTSVTTINFASGATLTSVSSGISTVSISAGITTTKYSPTANAIIQIGLGTAQHHELTLSAGFTTITTSGGTYGESHSLVLIQPSSGICTVGFSTYFLFPSGATPSMSEGSSKVDLISFVVKDVTGNPGSGITELLASAGLNYS
jgi:hypothetical protein